MITLFRKVLLQNFMSRIDGNDQELQNYSQVAVIDDNIRRNRFSVIFMKSHNYVVFESI